MLIQLTTKSTLNIQFHLALEMTHEVPSGGRNLRQDLTRLFLFGSSTPSRADSLLEY